MSIIYRAPSYQKANSKITNRVLQRTTAQPLIPKPANNIVLEVNQSITSSQINGYQTFLTGTKGSPKTTDHVTIQTGCCLFDRPSIEGLNPNTGYSVSLTNPNTPIQQEITEIKILNQESLNELETRLRLSDFINTYRKFLENQDIEVTVRALIPKVEYYTYFFTAFSQGLISEELLKQIYSSIDQRSAQVRTNMQSAIPDLEIVNPFDELSDRLFEAIAKNKLGLNLMQKLVSASSKEITSIIESNQSLFNNIMGLNLANYINGQIQAGTNGGLAIQVENLCERSQFKTSSNKKFLAQLNNQGINSNQGFGMYPLPKIYEEDPENPKIPNLDLYIVGNADFDRQTVENLYT